MFLNDIEEHLILNGFNGIDMYMTKLFLLLYADDTVIFADSAEELQKGLDVLHVYCQRWKLKINAQKTKVVIFRKCGARLGNLNFNFNGVPLEIVKSFSYLGVVFSQSGSYGDAHITCHRKHKRLYLNLTNICKTFLMLL